jgi:membrane fusion protein (multidrug efflux system)
MSKIIANQVFCTVTSFALAILFVGGCNEGKSRSPGGNSASRGGKLPVTAVVIKPQLLENKIYATGTMLANEEVELRSEVSGRVTGVYFNEGGAVKNGDLMLKINDRELQAQLKRKEIEEKLASDEESRKRSLLEINGISQEEYDRSVNALRVIQAEKEIIESQLAKTEIRAPFDGTVGLRYVSEGSYASNNMLAATMQDTDPMKVEFAIPEKYAQQIKKGTEIVARIGDLQEKYRGKVYAVESKIDLGTRTIKARATIPNNDGKLIPGSFARVEITLEKLANAIVIPAQAVIPELSGEKVYLFEDGKARSTPVKTGIRTESSIQILEGLAPDDTLVVTGLLQLTDGRAIEIRNMGSE